MVRILEHKLCVCFVVILKNRWLKIVFFFLGEDVRRNEGREEKTRQMGSERKEEEKK